jgi:glutamyl-tRNA reductase
VLERVTVPPRELAKALRRLCDSPHLSEAVIVSTCLRTEVYAVTERFHDGVADIEAFFDSRAGSGGEVAADRPPSVPRPPSSRVPGGPLVEGSLLTPGETAGRRGRSGALADQLYCAIDDAAAEHLFEVAAGIDSAVLGEGEILRQVREALDSARAGRAAGPVLETMFRHAVEVGKRARSETAIARGITSLSHAAVALAAETVGGSLGGLRVLVVGAGEMGAGMGTALERMTDAPTVVVANRSLPRAEEVAGRVGGEAIDLESMRALLGEVDVVLTSTAAPNVVIDESHVEPALARRGGRPLLIVDAAVPRNVDPSVASLDGVSLLDMDDISNWAERQMDGRAAELENVRTILGEELERYRAASVARQAAPLVSSLRARGEAVREDELARHRARLEGLSAAERDAVESLTKGIVAKL